MVRSGAELVIEALKAEEVEVVFGFPGGVVIPVFDQLERPVLSDFGIKTEDEFKALLAKARKSFDDRKSRF